MSVHKFDAGDGWPAFYDVSSPNVVHLVEKPVVTERWIEVLCDCCDGRLGHVFGDVLDQPTGLRFSINSVALVFDPDTKN